MSFETILVDREDRVGIITLNRPQALNALNSQVMVEVTTAAAEFDADPGIGAIVITGNAKAFAAGADIKEMATLSFSEVFDADFFAAWGKLAAVRTPTIAAVAGYALGGGCELAMMCDLIIAADTAKFGQPEINLGMIPGAGGTQRLPRIAGKSLAMQMVLTGQPIDARTALAAGIACEVDEPESALARAIEIATLVATRPPLAVRAAKAAVLRAFELPLDEGLAREREAFAALAATHDRNEGIAAFLEKRPPQFTGR